MTNDILTVARLWAGLDRPVRDDVEGVLDAEAKGPLDPEIISKINALRLNFYRPMIPMEV